MQQKNTIRANYNIIIQHHINAFYSTYCTVVGWSDFFLFQNGHSSCYTKCFKPPIRKSLFLKLRFCTAQGLGKISFILLEAIL